MPEHELSFLMTLNIGMTLSGILVTAISCWAIIRQGIQIAGMVERNSRSTERVAEIAERIDARLRRDFPDIGGELGD
jgi:hypothetical protein